MNRFVLLGGTSLLGLWVAGCGGFGGGGGGGGGTAAPINSGVNPIGSSSYIPTKVTRDPAGYDYQVAYQPNSAVGGAITAITVATTSTDMIVGITPLGKVDRVSASGATTEAAFVFDINGFATIDSDVFASTANPIAARAAQVFRRDVQGNWVLSLDGTQKEAVILPFAGTLFAFAGENDGISGSVSVLQSSSGAWREVASIGSLVPTAAADLGGEAYVGGHQNDSRQHGPVLMKGTGTSFTAVNVPFPAGPGQLVSVSALAVANNALFVAIEAKAANNGATIGGALLALDAKGLNQVNSYNGDAPIALQPLDGTIYVGTRAGKIQWLDEKGNWNDETVPANLGVTSLAQAGGRLFAGIKSSTGAKLLRREPKSGVVTPPPPTGAPVFTSITPSNGPVGGGTAVVIRGNRFAGVTQVFIGTTMLVGMRVVSDVEIRGTTPAGVAGRADVRIVHPTKGAVTGVGAFTYGTPPPPSLTYATDIMPILTAKCVSCHSANFKPLTPYSAILAFVVPGNATSSVLVQKTQPGGSMAVHVNAAQQTTIRDWVVQGAKP